MPKPILILGRDPAWWLAVVAVIVKLAIAYGLDLDVDGQAKVNAAATAVMGVILAFTVARDQILPAVAGLGVALGDLALQWGVFGWHPSPEQLAETSALVTLVLAGYLRTQVTAPIGPDWKPVPRVPIGRAA